MTAEFFQHFKGGVYKKIADAKHSETEEDLVVYQNCESGQVWVRPGPQFYGSKMTEGGSVVRFKPLTLAEKRKLVNWRHNPCPGTGREVPEKEIVRKESSFRTVKGSRAITKGRTLCPVCDKNVSFTSQEGVSAHKP